MSISATVLADSIADGCPRLTSLLVRFPHIILPQVLTHRQFSRNTSSSRAIPIARLIADVMRDPFTPREWRYAADRGMQPGELMDTADARAAADTWAGARDAAITAANELALGGAAKEHANRLVEPFSYVNMVITATEWANFYALRLDAHAQIEIRELAQAMRDAMDASTPRELQHGEWHLPLTQPDEAASPDAPMLSAARCARTSYLMHDGTSPTRDADARLAKRLLAEWHMSPFEHQAQALRLQAGLGGNFAGCWAQHRKIIEADA